MKVQREDLIQQYKRWIEPYEWDWFGTLKITSGIPSNRRANQLFKTWISDLRREEGGDDFRWFRVLERGTSGGNLHFHVLVGGVSNRRRFWARKWNDLGGDALITNFDAKKNGILYLLKTMNDDGELEFDCNLPPTKMSADAGEESLEWRKSTPTSILVEGIDGRTSSDELRQMFKAYGRILEVAIVESRIDRNVNVITVTITYQNSYAASMAVEGRNGVWLRRRPLRVSLWGRS